eukprot:scaffold675439_cov45-Prasinocladus_malaysianus.AAC.1
MSGTFVVFGACVTAGVAFAIVANVIDSKRRKENLKAMRNKSRMVGGMMKTVLVARSKVQPLANSDDRNDQVQSFTAEP